MTGPFSGLRVLDVTTTLSGPFCTLLLGDLGADVIKIETIGGDPTRSLGTVGEPGRASVFVGANRGKRSIALDLKRTEDVELFYALCRRADVVVHNMREAAVVSLGIDYASIRQIAPHIVYCAITGFGSTGPYQGRPAYDDSIQAIGGLAGQQSEGERAPHYMATAVADKTTGMFAALSIAAALYHKAEKGLGQYIEVPMFESVASWALVEHLGGRAFSPPAGPAGYERQRKRRPYRTKDGIVSVVVYHDRHWRRFLEHADLAELLEASGLSAAEDRNRNIGGLYDLLGDYVSRMTTEECLQTFAALDIPAESVVDLDGLFRDPHLVAVDFFQEVASEDGARFVVTRAPMIFSESTLTPPRDRPAPARLDGDRAALPLWT